MAVAAIISGILLTTQAASATVTGDESSNSSTGWIFGNVGMGRCGRSGVGRWGLEPYGSVEVSEEFKQNVINIAESDTDVQALLNDGYNVTGVRPIIKSVVGAEGNVVTQATSAIVMLQKDTAGHASVLVDLEQGKVTQIVILTRTVIDKS
jgi:hypothetical protein